MKKFIKNTGFVAAEGNCPGDSDCETSDIDNSLLLVGVRVERLPSPPARGQSWFARVARILTIDRTALGERVDTMRLN